jgi:hypothetical protein
MTTMPNFLVIGANKAGTTSLHNYLKQHPEIYMSRLKEPSFFSLEGKTIDRSQRDFASAINNLEDYQALFKKASKYKAIGESSTSYLCNPQAPECIKKYIPNVKLIAILRHPAERAYSNYIMYLGWGIENTPDFGKEFEKAKQLGNDSYLKDWHYTRLGFYYEQLKKYFQIFDRNQLKIYLYEDWHNNSHEVLRDIFQFLGVDETFVPNMSVRHNSAAIPKNKKIDSFIKKPNIIKDLIKPFIPFQLRRSLRDKIEKQNLGKPSLSHHVRQELINIYREDILKLQDLIHRDLSKWLQ